MLTDISLDRQASSASVILLHRIVNTCFRSHIPQVGYFFRRLNLQDVGSETSVSDIYIRLKIKPNSVRIRSLSCQICVPPSTGFELTPLIHCKTNRSALCPAPSTTSAMYITYCCYHISHKPFLFKGTKKRKVSYYISTRTMPPQYN